MADFERFFDICEAELRQIEKLRQSINDIESRGEEFRNNVNKFVVANYDCCDNEGEEHKEGDEDGDCLSHKFYFEPHYISNFEGISKSLSDQFNEMSEFLGELKNQTPQPLNLLISELSSYMRNVSDGHQSLGSKSFFIINDLIEVNQSLHLKLKAK